MLRNLILIFLGGCLFQTTVAQSFVIKGQVVNKESDLPVIAAHVVKPDGRGTYTDHEGKFILSLTGLPVTLRISHITYGESEVRLEKEPETLLVIRLDKQVTQIGEVQASAQRMRILTEKKDFNLQDYAFDNENLWMIGFLDNHANEQRLWLTSWFGDTISSIQIKRAERLYRDIFGNVHLVFGDSVYQLHAYKDSIMTLYPTSQADFFGTVAPIKAYFSNKLVYQTFLSGEEGLHTYYYELGDPEPKFLKLSRDTLEEASQEHDYVYGKAGITMAGIMNLSEKGGSAYHSAMFAMGQRKLRKGSIVNRKVKTEMFSVNDSLFVIDLYKDSLICFDSTGQYAYSMPYIYHRNPLLFDYHYKSIKYLIDPIVNSVYLLERKERAWELFPLIHKDGLKGQQVPLPDFAGMDNITVQGNAVYFLYHEKKHPYYTRLYRYQL